MPKTRIRHQVVRTRNLHSRAVIAGDTIIIRLARNLSQTEEREHIRDLLRRMTRHVLEERRMTVISPFRALLEGAERTTVRLASGKQYMFRLEAGRRTRAHRTLDGFVVIVGPGTKRQSLHRLLWKCLASAEEPRIAELVAAVNDECFGARVRRTRLAFAESQWGSCSADRVIMVNAALLFVPPSLLRYLIVHELAHLRRPDHSPAFWREVERAMPRYREAMKRIARFRLPKL